MIPKSGFELEQSFKQQTDSSINCMFKFKEVKTKPARCGKPFFYSPFWFVIIPELSIEEYFGKIIFFVQIWNAIKWKSADVFAILQTECVFLFSQTLST